MPGWHAKTQTLRDEGRLAMVGIVQEQHPQRARLFQQWQRLDWPLWADPLNLLEVPYVPITLAIDEHGVIRHIFSPRTSAQELASSFLEIDYPAPEEAAPDAPAATPAQDLGAYARAVADDPDSFWSWFRLGVRHLQRHDSPQREPGDFAAAIDAWRQALALDPNNYIARRRLQQYGPRLDKPYPFYDWVPEARAAVAARGETPTPLPVEPRGSEFARGEASFSAAEPGDPPDPQNRVLRDAAWVRVQAVAVPGTAANTPTRVHVILTPGGEAHWNNEVEPAVVWLDVPPGWRADRHRAELPLPQTPLSREERWAEFEVLPSAESMSATTLNGYALYYVCEDTNGACLYRRADFSVTVEPLAGP